MAFLIRDAKREDAPAIAKVHVDTWRTTYKGVVPDEYLAQISYERRLAMWQSILSRPNEKEHLLILEHEGVVIGFVSAGAMRDGEDPKAGEVFAVYILESFQGQGQGRKLIEASLSRLKAAGFQTMTLWALEENEACGFYTHCGGEPVAEKWEEIGGKRLKEVAFRWNSLE